MKEFKSSFYRGIRGSIIGEVTFKKEAFYSRSKKIFVTDNLDVSALGYKACITKGEKGAFFIQLIFIMRIGQISCMRGILFI